MTEDLSKILQEIKTKTSSCNDLKILQDIKVHYLGKNGKITGLLKQVGNLTPEEKKSFGQQVNNLKQSATTIIDERKLYIEKANLDEIYASEAVDVTLPGRKLRASGKSHPINVALCEMVEIFRLMGFNPHYGPDIESEDYNFTKLNIPAEHPARAMHDTFFIDDNDVLRTHTSPVQIRTMLNNKPPIQIIAPGKVYRKDADVTHTPMFHQIEGLLIDKKVSFANLKGVLNQFLRTYFGKELKSRFRSSYFPFTEPSAEVDITCVKCDGKGCRICKNTGWLEVLGCGMVHPQVLKNCGIDPNEYQGFAFGLGVERFAMLKYEIADLRWFYENDIRFLRQF